MNSFLLLLLLLLSLSLFLSSASAQGCGQTPTLSFDAFQSSLLSCNETTSAWTYSEQITLSAGGSINVFNSTLYVIGGIKGVQGSTVTFTAYSETNFGRIYAGEARCAGPINKPDYQVLSLRLEFAEILECAPNCHAEMFFPLYQFEGCTSSIGNLAYTHKTAEETCIVDVDYYYETSSAGDTFVVKSSYGPGDCDPQVAPVNTVQIVAIVLVIVVVLILIVIGVVVWKKNKKRFGQDHFSKQFEKDNASTRSQMSRRTTMDTQQ